MSNNKPLKNSTKLLFTLDKFIFLVNTTDSLEEIEIIRDLCCDYFHIVIASSFQIRIRCIMLIVGKL